MPASVESAASGIAIRLTCSGRVWPAMGCVPPDTNYGETTMTVNQQKLDALVGRLFADLSAGYGGVMVSLGDKLGLYRAMAGAGPLSAHEVARRSGCAE